MAKILEMFTSRKFWLTITGMVAAFAPYLEGMIDFKTAFIAAGMLLVNYIFQLGKTDAAKITTPAP